MEVKDLINRDIVCSCGRIHRCDINSLCIEEGALEKLPELLETRKNILLVADSNTYSICGERVHDMICEKIADVCVFDTDGKILIPDEKSIDILDSHTTTTTDLILGIGSGVINDLCKYVSFAHKISCGIIATAPSMDGYASSGAAMIIEGMKVTYTTHAPEIIIGDTDILKNAPMDMIRSGYGDIIGKYSSLNDWKLANLICGEYLCPYIYDIVLKTTDDIRDSVSDIVARDSVAIEKLMNALVLIGMTLTFVETTRPGSGSEHHLSHFFEIVGLIKNENHFSHGTDVAYNTIVTAAVREKIRSLDEPVFCEESKTEREKAWEDIYGKIADEVKELQKESGMYARDMKPIYTEKWNEIRSILSECPSADECNSMMRAAGFSFSEYENLYGEEKIQNAVTYGKDLKNRYSVLWIFYTLFSGKKQTVDFFTLDR